MNKFTKLIAGFGLATAVVVPSVASAQSWVNINARQSRLDSRIDQGIRSGALTRREAVNLRSEFRGLSRLEARYRAGGLNNWERNDLNRRFDALSAKVRFNKHDRQHRR